jgi:hypothetical protein
MELVLIKNKENMKVYQGNLDYHETDHYFFATVINGEIKDLVAYTIGDDGMTMQPVAEYTKGALFEILADEYVHSGIR